MKQNLVALKPIGEFFRISGSHPDVLGALTTEICNITDCTTTELGIVRNLIFLDKKTTKKNILTTFEIEKVQHVDTDAFGDVIITYPKLEALAGYFFAGSIENCIYDIDEKRGEVTFRWHPNLTIAYLCKISLLDPDFKITEEIAVAKQKQKDNSQVPIILTVTCRINHKPYDIEEIPAYFEMLASKN